MIIRLQKSIEILVNSVFYFKSFDECLMSGGDHRLSIMKGTSLNLYGCSPKPIKHISYSSSTASTVGHDAYCYVDHIFSTLNKNPSCESLVNEFQSIRDRIRSYIGSEDSVDIALGPSGTDMELIALAAALYKNDSVTNILVARDEVGSGTEFAASGRHSTSILPSRKVVNKGEVISGFERFDIDLNFIPVRDEVTGEILSVQSVTSDVLTKVKAAVSNERHVLLHLVYRTKTGIVSPCFDSIKKILEMYPGKVDVVVDACQYRMSNESLNYMLKSGCMVIITGSKFYAGAPFSSALLVPESIRDRFVSDLFVPEGLSDYFSRSELPIRWRVFDRVLNRNCNLGLLLRWETALFEMRSFSGVHVERFGSTAHLFKKTLSDIIGKYSNISIVEEDKGASLISDSDVIFNQTIQTFIVNDLDINDAKFIYKALYTDLSVFFDEPYAGVICHIGQPVKVRKNIDGKWCAALRISLNSRFFSQESGKILLKQEKIIEDELFVVFEKLKLIVNNFELIKTFLI